MNIKRKNSITITNAFSVIELLLAVTVLTILLLLLMGVVAIITDVWVESERTIQSKQRARASLELFTREITPAVVDTRMQFVVAPGKNLEKVGAKFIAPDSPAVLWMAPLGIGGELRCVGYYLYRNEKNNHYRLKRIYIRKDNQDGYFPKLIDLMNARNPGIRTDSLSSRWFVDNWDSRAFDDTSAYNQKVIVSTVADGVVAFWVQCLDLLGNPIPLVSESQHHPRSDLLFNSAAYFHMATSTPFDNGDSFVYLAKTPFVMKAHRLPAEMEISIITIGDVVLERGLSIPQMENVMSKNGSLDMKGSVKLHMEKLQESGITEAKVYTTRVKLSNGV
ncbi:MAG: hypothetical protein GXP30_10855 [Verrucomicrobia bacterium]|nr:hypothetical protein [Verrucomicrobiota bacterium]